MSSYQYYKFYKPYDVLSQFSKEIESHVTLADFLDVPSDVYPIGRLDRDSEGLLLLSNEKSMVKKLMDPASKMPKTYWVQVDGDIGQEAIQSLRSGVLIKLPNKKMHHTLPAQVKRINAPLIEERVPPVRYRKEISTSWISITITEGKNRQIRKMCAKVGHPVLRLVRYAIGSHTLEGLKSGKYTSTKRFIS